MASKKPLVYYPSVSAESEIGPRSTWASVPSGAGQGNASSFAILSDNTLYACGANTNYVLGLNDTTDRYVFTQISSAAWSAVAGNYAQGLAIKSDGTLWGWGYNQWYELGLGNITTQRVPIQVGSATNWSKIATYGYDAGSGGFSFGITSDGKLWSWGQNGVGQLGQGDTTQRTTPTQVGSGTTWTHVSLGEFFALARKSDGTLWACGLNVSGYGMGVGDGSTHSSFVQIGSGTTWSDVCAGFEHGLALKSDGTLWAFGDNVNGQLGQGNTTPQLSPVQVGSATNWTKISAGWKTTYAVNSSGELWCCGAADVGQLGDGAHAEYDNLVKTVSEGCASVSAFYHYAIALNTDGTMWVTGYNDHGQLGLNDVTERDSWTQVTTPTVVDTIPVANLPENVAAPTHAATSKSTPVDNDELPVVDSAASNVLKKLTWSNLKATLKTYFDTLYKKTPTLMSVTATTSGTSISFTGIPGGVKRITMVLQGVSTSGIGTLAFRLGNGSLVASGYLGGVINFADTVTTTTNETTGLRPNGAAGDATTTLHGVIVANLIDATNNKWAIQSIVSNSNTTSLNLASATLALSSALDRVALVIASGSGAFDAGSINVLYE